MALADAVGTLTGFRLLLAAARTGPSSARHRGADRGTSLWPAPRRPGTQRRVAAQGADRCRIEPVIAPKSNRRFPAEFNRETYKWRHLIGNLFGRLKEYKGIAIRCCKTDESFSALLALPATLIQLQ
jgi:transposase